MQFGCILHCDSHFHPGLTERMEIMLIFVELCFWHVRIVSFAGCLLQLNNICYMAVLQIELASLIYLPDKAFIVHLILVSVCCVVICKILHRHACLSSSCRVVQMSVSDFKLGWCLTCSEPDRSNCTEMKSSVQMLDFLHTHKKKKHNSMLTFDLFLISNIYLRSLTCLKLWDNNSSHPALRRIWMLAQGLASSRMQPF